MEFNKSLIILSLLLVFCISLSAVSATEDISVNDTTDNSVTTVESSPMNEEINAVGGGEIHRSSEIDINSKSRLTNDYQIDKTWVITRDNAIIDGQGHTIYGNGKQAFYISGYSVTIKNLNFVNCSASGSGGAIYFMGWGYSYVINCSFVNCSASDDDGGAIYFCGIGEVQNSSFVNCSASGSGGAIYFSYTSSKVMDCSFVNCSADCYDYSAIYDILLVYVKDCSFENCKGKDNNGSTPIFKPKVILTVDDIEGISGSTVKVNVGVHDILGTPINEGTVSISLNGKEYTAKVIDGIATFNIIIPSKEAIYFANVLFNGEGTRYDNTTCNFTVINILDNNGNATGNDTEDINKSVVSNKINNVINIENCGNPLIALLIALISLPLIRRK